MKRFCVAAAAVTMAVSAVCFPAMGEQWYDKAVKHCVENGIISEDYDITGLLTRGEMAQMLANELGTEVYYTYIPFEDAEADSPYIDALMTLYSAGIYEGSAHADGKLTADMGRALTREQAAAFIVRTYGFEGSGEIKFSDKDSISDYAVSDVAILSCKGVLSGYDDDTFRPQKQVTKTEFMTMLLKADEAVGEKGIKADIKSLMDTTALSDNLKTEIKNETPIMADDEITISFSRLSRDPGALYVFNPQRFQLEKLQNGTWTVIERNANRLTDISYQLKADSDAEKSIVLSELYEGLESGEYRLVYKFDVNGVGVKKGAEYTAVGFEITETV